ncbi:uncharacterized protein LOC130229674 [Danio aesculapii]|uniref:uncharacterized protein LOC130229674 n=2 Tax=Danio aesculapii TaxID=1142201 RepID=UPI0024C072D2|nr:uncharacterized protein LOC130229674 [Danio aesculapii]
MERYMIRYPQGRARAGENDRPTGQTSVMTTYDEQLTREQPNDLSRVCRCGRICKNERGLKIHQSKMKCLQPDHNVQRTGKPGETEERQGQEANHSPQNLQAHYEDGNRNRGIGVSEDTRHQVVEGTKDSILPQQDTCVGVVRKEQVNWPAAVAIKQWEKFDQDVDEVLEAALAGDVGKKLRAMAAIMWSMGADRFGKKELKVKAGIQLKENRRMKEIAILRGDLRRLRKVFREAPANEKPALSEIRDNLRERIKTLRRAECHRRDRRKRMKAQTEFIKNPFRYLSNILGDVRSGQLEATKEEVEDHLRQAHSDPRREKGLGEMEKLLKPTAPSILFRSEEPSWQEVNTFLRKARAKSAPGPNGIPYKVYKCCERLRRRLWKLLRVAWKKDFLADSWLVAEGCFIPKEGNSSGIKQFRTISLLNVEGKIFLGILAKRLTSFMMDNGYMDTSVQKGGVPGVSGCLEHTSVVTKIIEDAKKNRGDLAVLWLDLTNAYGTIPHKLVDLTLETYHVPERFRKLLQCYYGKFHIRFTCRDFTTEWQRLEVGIVTGCTISVILFSAAINLLVKSAEKLRRGAILANGKQQVPIRAFMDDLTIMAKSVPEGRWILEDLVELTDWARMEFKPEKSRSLVLRRGCIQDRFRFRIKGTTIPTVREKPVKSLGKWYRADLNDKESVRQMSVQVDTWMTSLEKSGLPGKYKAWGYQHGVLPRLLWPLLVYEVPVSTVEGLERKMNTYLRRWLGVPRSFCSIGLYSTGSKLQLPLTSVLEEYKVTKTRQAIMLRDSQDEKVRQADLVVGAGRKWSANKAVRDAEERLQHADIVGTVAQGRLGLGCFTSASWNKADPKERRWLIQREVRKAEEETRQVKAVGMKKQGSWTRWEGVRERALTWQDIWSMEGQRIKFLLCSVYDVLPTPSNLHIWGMVERPSCSLCGKQANLEHVLSACQSSLADGKFRWRHDKILSQLADGLEQARKKVKQHSDGQCFIQFIRSGESIAAGRRRGGVLASAKDWEMRADLKKQLKYPEEIAQTSLRPDIVLWSRGTKQVVLIELTIPWEERMEEAHERKLKKYQSLILESQENGWRAWNLPVEVGCRGFAGQSLWRALGWLGIEGMARKRLVGKVTKEAEVTSRWIWLQREVQWESQPVERQTIT